MKRALPALVAGALVLGACGGDDGNETEVADTTASRADSRDLRPSEPSRGEA